ncbi:ATP-dependent DNA helicase PIF1 [Linum perenne]
MLGGGGDFRQTLPVVPNGGREDNINASLPRSYLWSYCTLLQLFIKMRISDLAINNAPIFEGLTFSQWVLSVGNAEPVQSIIAKVYLDFATSFSSVGYIKSRAIVTPINVVVSEINDYLLEQIQGMSKLNYCTDSLATTGSNKEALDMKYPLEFLNSLSFNGVPEHDLKLKPFCTVMLLRNLNPSVGLCNGTRILLTNIGNHHLYGIVLDVKDTKWPFILKRRQFPIRLCYAMTINKSQGQTLDQVGLYLPKPISTHGQLYVDVSRVRSVASLHIVLGNEESASQDVTRNIVYDEILFDYVLCCDKSVTIFRNNV